MQTAGDLVGVALVVQLQQAVEDLALRRRADCVAGLAAYRVETVGEAADRLNPVFPAVGPDGGLVDGAVDAAELDDVLVGAGGVEDEVVGLGEAESRASMRSRR